MVRKILLGIFLFACFVKSNGYKLKVLEEKIFNKNGLVYGQHLVSSSSSHSNCACENGYCERDSTGEYKCVCWPEYGRFSDTKCKACWCGPAANCTIEVGWFKDKFSCICPKGVMKGIDKRCEDPCDSSPCLNEGNCSVDYNGVKCDCQHPFTGKFCEEKKSVCLENTCANGGTCIEADNGRYKCNCRPNFSGTDCEKTLCSQNPCRNGGMCQVTDDGFDCFCKHPFRGLRCEEEETITTSDPSSTNTEIEVTNDLTTLDRNITVESSKDPDDIEETITTSDPSSTNTEIKVTNDLTTLDQNITVESWEDPDDITIDPCEPNPCKNDFSCTVKKDTFKCKCKLPYRGSTCELSPCNPSKCENGATCTVHKFSYKCDCLPGYHGDRCSYADCTQGDVCKNGGTCKEENEKIICSCVSPFSGPYCENKTEDK